MGCQLLDVPDLCGDGFGHGKLADWAGVENLEERVDGEDEIDPVVLARLRESA